MKQTKCVLAGGGSSVFDVKRTHVLRHFICLPVYLTACGFGGFEYLNEAELTSYFGRRLELLPPLRMAALSLLSL